MKADSANQLSKLKKWICELDFCSYCLGAIAAFFYAFIGIIHDRGYRTGLFFAGTVFSIMALICWYQYYVESNFLLPDNLPDPKIQIPQEPLALIPEKSRLWATTVSPNEVALVLGNLIISTQKKSFSVLKACGKELIKLRIIDDNKAGISLDIYDDDGKIIATLEDNKWRLNPNKTLPLLRPDAHTIIVQNEKKEEVLNVHYLNKQFIRIKGVFKTGGKYPIIIDDKKIKFGHIEIGGWVVLHMAGGPLFEWTNDINEKTLPDNLWSKDIFKDGVYKALIIFPDGRETSLFQFGFIDVGSGVELFPMVRWRLIEHAP